MKQKHIILTAVLVVVSGVLFADNQCAGMEYPTIGCIFDNIRSAFKPLGKLMVAVSYLSGIGFFVAAVFKFKQVKDNPTQIPIGTPFALLLVAVLLVFLPGVFGYSAWTLFGKEGKTGGFDGDEVCNLPGEEDC